MSEHSPEANRPSPDDSATNLKSSAPKNKACPFCGDQFTSSSLGRHLDLYIKEKNPKAADGIHHVDKIRQIRGHITRRQPKRTSQKTEVSTPASDGRYPRGVAESPYGFVIGTDEHRRIMINRPTWEATGVMTDIPANGLRLNLGARKQLSRSDAAVKRRMAEDRTRLRAAELALQEVLDSVNAASAQAHPPSPFDFDFLSQPFPALCLRMLLKQPTIGTSQVIENPKCCPVRPPDKTHYELLRRQLTEKLEDFERAQSQSNERHDLHDIFSPSEPTKDSRMEKLDTSPYYNHLSQAFDVWKSTPNSQKDSLWHLETLRACSSAQEEAAKLRDQLLQAEAQTAHLRLQIARLNECQQPKEYTYNIPANYEVSQETVKVLASSKADVPLDRESLIKKWTAVVKDDRKYQRSLPELELADLTIPDDVNMEDNTGEGGHRNGNNLEGEGDSVDAAGEDDDEVDSHPNGVDGDSPSVAANNPVKINAGELDRGVLDPSLRDNDDDDGAMEVDKGDFGAETLLADMKARARSRK